MGGKLRNSGIDIIGDVPWGTHFCQFYQTKEDLVEILVPYFKVGLENNEFCLLITSDPLEVKEAKEALGMSVQDIDSYLDRGQIEIISYTCLHVTGSIYDSERIISSWVEKLNHALKSGYEGLRLSGNTSWLENKIWGYPVEHIRKMDDIIEKYRIIAMGSYFVDKCSATEIIEVVSNHQFSLTKKEGKWERIDNFGRKKAEEAAIHTTMDWEQTFDAVPDLIAILDTEYRVVRANRAMSAKLRMTPEECMGLTCYRVVHGTDEPPSFCPHRQLLKDALEHTEEVCDDCLGGCFIISVSPLHDSEGKLTGSVHVARDITERKKAEEALKKAHDNLEEKVKERTAELEEAYKLSLENERRFNEAQRRAHIGSWDWNIVTEELYISDEVYRIFERIPQEFATTYDAFLNYVHPDDRDIVDNAVKKALNGEPFVVDYRIVLADGAERIIHEQGEVIFDKNDNTPILIGGTVQDITERKKAEEKIQILANVVESSNDAIITGSLDGIVTSWNKGAEQIYGYSAEEIVGKNASILEPDHLKGEIKQFAEKIKQGEKVKNYETVRLRKGGTSINVSLTLSPVLDDSGRVIAISVIARDITERIKAEKSLVKAEDARKKEIHHRIKNNLQVISSLLDLQADKFNDQKVIEAFRESQSRVISMALIHEELYKEKGTDALNFSEYLKTLAENLFQTYILSSKNIHLKMDLEENSLLNMDIAVPLGIIVNELISNSLKHAFPGRNNGEISVILRREESKNEESKSTCYTLTVSDNGVGIPENLDIENLDSLGLQLVASLVDQLDGELELKRNNGTEFTIRFTVIEKEGSQ